MNGSKKTCPQIPLDVLEYLDALYPDRCAYLDESDRMIWYRAGQRSVVRSLYNTWHKQQEEQGLAAIRVQQ